ncbi:MAG: TatD family hydrolase [Bacteroidota bacterium]
MFVDTHAHLYAEQFNEDRDAMLERAKSARIEKVYLPAIDQETHDAMLDLEANSQGYCEAMMGLHPVSVKADVETELGIVEKWLGERPFCAIGEIGIDLYWDKTYFEEQKMAFKRQIDWARSLKKPFVIHSRDSTQIIIDILKKEQDGNLKGIFHCFTGTKQEAAQIMDLGFLMGIGGVVTFKNGGLDKTVVDIPLEHLVLETDAPYLTPTPFRGKRNETAYIEIIAKKLAETKAIELESLAEITTRNAYELFDPGG